MAASTEEDVGVDVVIVCSLDEVIGFIRISQADSGQMAGEGPADIPRGLRQLPWAARNSTDSTTTHLGATGWLKAGVTGCDST